MYDRESTRSKGFGFVNFADESSVDKAMLVPGLAIEGKMVSVACVWHV
jgi:RNA recognition motif-containing protein